MMGFTQASLPSKCSTLAIALPGRDQSQILVCFFIKFPRTIMPGSYLTRSGGNIQCPDLDTLFNRGTLTLLASDIVGLATSVFKNENENFSELKYAKKVAKHLNSNLKIIEIDDQMFLDKLSNINKYTDEPLSDLASVPLKFVSDLAAKDVKVVLSGEGADEILAGYDLYNVERNIKFLKQLNRYKPFSFLFKKIFRLLFSASSIKALAYIIAWLSPTKFKSITLLLEL